MQQPSLNEEIARLLFPNRSFTSPKLTPDDGRRIMVQDKKYVGLVPNYSEDLNAAVEALETLNYEYDTTRARIENCVMVDGGVGRRLIRKDFDVKGKSPQEITKAIATALCEALLEAESEAENEQG